MKTSLHTIAFSFSISCENKYRLLDADAFGLLARPVYYFMCAWVTSQTMNAVKSVCCVPS